MKNNESNLSLINYCDLWFNVGERLLECFKNHKDEYKQSSLYKQAKQALKSKKIICISEKIKHI